MRILKLGNPQEWEVCASASTSTTVSTTVEKLLNVLSQKIHLNVDSSICESTNMHIMVKKLLEPLTAEAILERRQHKGRVHEE